jgi:tetratricopeptide (TPR) repeat protein
MPFFKPEILIRTVKKRIMFFTVAAAVLFAVLAKAGVDTFYRIKLPVPPDLTTLPEPLKEQLTSASKKARLWPSAANIGYLGMVYHSGAFYDKAAEAYRLAIRKKSREWIWHYYLGYLEQEMGNAGESIDNFRIAAKLNDKAYHAWYYVGKGYQNLGENQKAEGAFKYIIDHPVKTDSESSAVRTDYFPLRVHALYNLARIYNITKRTGIAEQTLKQILDFHRSFGPAYRLLGEISRQNGDETRALYFLTRANDLVELVQPVDTLIDRLSLMSRSDIYILKQIDEAERTLHPEWALQLAQNALSFYPDDRNLISRTIKILIKLDRGKESGSLLNKHLGLFRDNFAELKETGNLLAEKGFPMQAMLYFNQAINLNPDDNDCRMGLVSCLWSVNMKQDALNQADDLLKKNEGNRNAETEIISMLIRMGEKEKAGELLTKLSRTGAEDAGLRKLAGMLAESNGDLRNAAANYKAALKKDPADFPSIKYLGNILMRIGLWNESIDHFKTALKQYPNNPYLLERLGTLLVSCPDERLRNYEDGKEYSERAFINNGCPADILIASGKSLAEAYA